MENTEEIDLMVIFRLLFKKKKMIILTAIISVVVFYCGSALLLTPTYTSSVRMYVNSNQDQTTESITINDINASQQLVNTYIVILTDDEVMKKLAGELKKIYGKDLSEYLGRDKANYAKKLREMITLTAVNNTEVLQISAETVDPQFSADVCEQLTEIAPRMLQRVVKAGSIEVIGKAEPNPQKSGPNNTKNALMGGMVVTFLLIAGLIVRNLLDNTIKGEEDLRDKLGIQTLGEVPDFANAQKGGYYGK